MVMHEANHCWFDHDAKGGGCIVACGYCGKLGNTDTEPKDVCIHCHKPYVYPTGVDW